MFFVECRAANQLKRKNHSTSLSPISCLCFQTKIRGKKKSPVTSTGLDKTTIKGSNSEAPNSFAANRMSKYISLRSSL